MKRPRDNQEDCYEQEISTRYKRQCRIVDHSFNQAQEQQDEEMQDIQDINEHNSNNSKLSELIATVRMWYNKSVTGMHTYNPNLLLEEWLMVYNNCDDKNLQKYIELVINTHYSYI